MRNDDSRQVRRGDVWTLNLNPVIGDKQGGHRPAIVLSSDLLHLIPSQLVVIVPITTRDRQIASYVAIEPPEGDLSRLSFARTEQLRTVSQNRLDRYLGHVEPGTLDDISKRVRRAIASYWTPRTRSR